MTGIEDKIHPGPFENFGLYNSGDLTAVKSFCDVLLAAHPHSAIVYNVLGVALEGQGNLEDSLSRMRLLLKRILITLIRVTTLQSC